MSGRRPTLVLAIQARSGLRSVLFHTGKVWRDAQRDRYRDALNEAFETLTSNPAIGRDRDDLAPGARGFVVRQHTVFYRIERNTIRVLRILHVRRDPRGLLPE